MAGREVIAGFASGQRIHAPVAISGDFVEYFLPCPLAGIVVEAIAETSTTTIPSALLTPWLLDAVRFGIDGPLALPVDDAALRSLAVLSQGPVTAGSLCAAHALLLRRPQPLRWRDAIAWVDGRSPAQATLVPPPSSAIDALIDDLGALLARCDVPTWIRQALAYYQFIHIHPFADGNGRLSRMLVAALGAASGARLPAMLVALALCLHRKAMTRHFVAPRDGAIGDYLDRWRRLDVWAHDYANHVSAIECALFTELNGLVGPNSAPRLFNLFAGGGGLSLPEVATTLRGSVTNARRHVARLREAGWIDGADDAFVCRRLRAVQRDLVVEIERRTSPLFA